MKSRKFKIAYVLVALGLSLVACKKEAPNIYNKFSDVSVAFKGDHPFSVVDYKEVNDGDSVYIDFTIISAKEDMAAVCIRREGQETPVLQINLPEGVDKRSYSGVYKLKATRAGENKYRVYALNTQATYIGDGYKFVVFNVKPDFTFIANRKVYLPDTLLKDKPCYYSVKLGESFSYMNGQKVSADLDFGLYRTQAPEGNTNATGGYFYHLYSLSADPLFFNVYDISTWTKKGTLFSNQLSEASIFTNNLTSSSIIGTTAASKTINLKETARAAANSIRVGSVVYFKTPEGKFGAIHFKQITSDLNGKVYCAINVKVQN